MDAAEPPKGEDTDEKEAASEGSSERQNGGSVLKEDEKAHIMDELFGGSSDDEMPNENLTMLSDSDDEKKGGLFGSDDEEDRALPEDEKQEKPQYGKMEDITFELVDLPRPPPDSKLLYFKLPNIIGVEPRPFDPDTYAGEPAEGGEDGEGKLKRLLPETVIRWRWVKNEQGENIKRESNARFVRWSDGSLQLFLGGDEEILDAELSDISKDHFHIFARQSGLIQCHGKLNSKLFVRPTTVHSKSHQKLTMAVVKHTKKQARKIRMVAISQKDPEQLKKEQEEREEERIKSRQKLEHEQRKAYQQLESKFLEEGTYEDFRSKHYEPSSGDDYSAESQSEESDVDLDLNIDDIPLSAEANKKRTAPFRITRLEFVTPIFRWQDGKRQDREEGGKAPQKGRRQLR